MRYSTPIVLSLAVAAACLLPACGKAYMAAAEAFGYEKREMLTDRVEAARDQQMEAREQFESALDEFRALTGPIDEDLEELYDRLDKQLDRSRSKASGVRSRIAKVEEVADDIRVERAIEDKDAVRGFAETTHAARSWTRQRRVSARIEATRLGLDIRYVVTSIASGTAEWLYADLYCARGQA
ncbi:MAG: DUF2959 family protein, partial [Phycisphaerales bacterium]|nr:DUF2959 family protein [Phycisphaerales bacterium]